MIFPSVSDERRRRARAEKRIFLIVRWSCAVAASSLEVYLQCGVAAPGLVVVTVGGFPKEIRLSDNNLDDDGTGRFRWAHSGGCDGWGMPWYFHICWEDVQGAERKDENWRRDV